MKSEKLNNRTVVGVLRIWEVFVIFKLLLSRLLVCFQCSCLFRSFRHVYDRRKLFQNDVNRKTIFLRKTSVSQAQQLQQTIFPATQGAVFKNIVAQKNLFK